MPFGLAAPEQQGLLATNCIPDATTPCPCHLVRYPCPGINTFFGRAAALISSTNNVANIQKIMTRIGAVCLVTIGIWVIIELIVAFTAYKHECYLGIGAWPGLQGGAWGAGARDRPG